MRQNHPALKDGDFRFLCANDGFVAFERTKGEDHLIVLANVGESHLYSLPGAFEDAITGALAEKEILLPKNAWRIFSKRRKCSHDKNSSNLQSPNTKSV
jgi:hypothetical protein